jgi:hypothetical protein
VTKWIDFFVLHKSVQAERITGRLIDLYRNDIAHRDSIESAA